jgi:4-oxalocrotonate tautomerase
MPLVNISLRRGTPPEYRKAIADGVHRAMVDVLEIPVDDRFQLVHEHAPENMLHDPTFLGVGRSAESVFVQIFINTRPPDQKRKLYQRIVDNLVHEPGICKPDIFIGVVEVAAENWWAYAHHVDDSTTTP